MKDSVARLIAILLGVGGYVGGLLAADSLNAEALGELPAFFTAAAAILLGLLVALGMGAAIADTRGALAPMLFKIVVCLVLALAASLTGLAPHLPAGLTRQLFALTVAGSAVSGFGVILVAFAAVYPNGAQRASNWRERLRAIRAARAGPPATGEQAPAGKQAPPGAGS